MQHVLFRAKQKVEAHVRVTCLFQSPTSRRFVIWYRAVLFVTCDQHCSSSRASTVRVVFVYGYHFVHRCRFAQVSLDKQQSQYGSVRHRDHQLASFEDFADVVQLLALRQPLLEFVIGNVRCPPPHVEVLARIIPKLHQAQRLRQARLPSLPLKLPQLRGDPAVALLVHFVLQAACIRLHWPDHLIIPNDLHACKLGGVVLGDLHCVDPNFVALGRGVCPCTFVLAGFTGGDAVDVCKAEVFALTLEIIWHAELIELVLEEVEQAGSESGDSGNLIELEQQLFSGACAVDVTEVLRSIRWLTVRVWILCRCLPQRGGREDDDCQSQKEASTWMAEVERVVETWRRGLELVEEEDPLCSGWRRGC